MRTARPQLTKQHRCFSGVVEAQHDQFLCWFLFENNLGGQGAPEKVASHIADRLTSSSAPETQPGARPECNESKLAKGGVQILIACGLQNVMICVFSIVWLV